jgi:hypothetical protein
VASSSTAAMLGVPFPPSSGMSASCGIKVRQRDAFSRRSFNPHAGYACLQVFLLLLLPNRGQSLAQGRPLLWCTSSCHHLLTLQGKDLQAPHTLLYRYDQRQLAVCLSLTASLVLASLSQPSVACMCVAAGASGPPWAPGA